MNTENERVAIVAAALYAVIGNEWLKQAIGGDLFEYQQKQIKSAFISNWYNGTFEDYDFETIAEIYRGLTGLDYADLEAEIEQDINGSCEQNQALIDSRETT